MNYLENPHLPEAEVTLSLIDCTAEKNIIMPKNQSIVQSYPHKNILEGINTHPDMTFCHLYGQVAVVDKEAYPYYFEQLCGYGFSLIAGSVDLTPKYPKDIAYNCVILNGCLYHNLRYTAPEILDYARMKQFKMINVKQGYTKCATLIVDDNSVITSDVGLYNIYKDNGLNVLYVSDSTIKLKNFPYGFIGGAGGKLAKDKMAFFGDIIYHPDFKKINEFLEYRHVSYIYLSKDPLIDYGSLIPLLHI